MRRLSLVYLLHCCVFNYLIASADAVPVVRITSTSPAVNQTDGLVHAVIASDVQFSCEKLNVPDTVSLRWQLTKPSNDPWQVVEAIASGDTVSDTTKYHVIRASINTWTLTVKYVQLSDEGNYTCYVQTSATSRAQDTVGLMVLVQPRILSSETDTEVIVAEMKNVSLRCGASGTPTPSYTWTRLDNENLPPPISRKTYQGNTLHLTDISHTYAGGYKCSADNGVPPSASVIVYLYVEFGPKIRADNSSYQQVRDHFKDIILACYVNGYPTPRVVWYKEPEKGPLIHITSDRLKYKISTWRRATPDEFPTALLIRNINVQDYGVYVCRATNQRSIAAARITLSESLNCQGKDCHELPWKFTFRSPIFGEFRTQYRLNWIDETHAAPKEYIIFIKQTGIKHVTWNQTKIPSNRPSDDGIHLYNYTFDNLIQNTGYVTRLQARNVYGLSIVSQEFYFRTSYEDAPQVKNTPVTKSEANIEQMSYMITFILLFSVYANRCHI